MTVATIIGARPQFIKASAVSQRLGQIDRVREVVIHTGQHYDSNMSSVFFDELGLPEPDFSLGIGGGTHGEMTGRQIEQIERVLIQHQPDQVLVYGDTNSTLAGALAAVKLNIPVAHVEAGLRSYNRRMPEEINRIVTDHISTLHFAPSAAAVNCLAREGISGESVKCVGDVMYDVAMIYADRSTRPSALTDRRVETGEFVLATIHRAENTDDPLRLRGILEGLARSSSPVVLPLHPRTQRCMDRFHIAPPASVLVVPPVSYLEMLWLERNCRVVATDSGGVQKEAYFHRKPCVTLRDETEWTELVEIGANQVVGTDTARIAMRIEDAAWPSDAPTDLYGDGDAAGSIVDALLSQSLSSHS